MSINRQQIKKMWYLYIMEYYLGIKKGKFETCVGKWIHFKNIILNEINQTQA